MGARKASFKRNKPKYNCNIEIKGCCKVEFVKLMLTHYMDWKSKSEKVVNDEDTIATDIVS